MTFRRLSILLCALIATGASPPPNPSGHYEVVAVRASSEVAGTLEAMRDPALNALVGRRMTFGRRVAWYDGRSCATGDVRASEDGWPHLAEPNLSDLQVTPGGTDHRLNRAMVIDCGGRAHSEITPFLMVDERVLVMPSRNGIAYVFTRDCILGQKTIKGARTGVVVIEELVANIDTEIDVEWAEFLARRGAR